MADYIEFDHGQCEDSGIGDLDDDGDIDYVANGGWVYFNPGASEVRDRSRWTRMTLFTHQRRAPTVTDVDGDGLNDLVVKAQEWYRQPADGKHQSESWRKHTIGETRWPMNCIMHDVDQDGDTDIVASDRGVETCWFVNPEPDELTGRWERRTLHDHSEPMFMEVADVNGDGVSDFVIAGGDRGRHEKKAVVLLRTNRSGAPAFEEVLIDQASGDFPKGVTVMDLDGDPSKKEILVLPKGGSLWMATYTGDPTHATNWETTALEVPGAQTRRKMDDAWLGDIDGDGVLDVATTEENGGWGVIWFENPRER